MTTIQNLELQMHGMFTLALGENLIPSISSNTIFIPPNPKGELTWLDEGKKFLLRTPMVENHESDRHDVDEEPYRVYYCGSTGKTLFTTRLKPEAFDAYEREGEIGFENFLKPDYVRYIERKLGFRGQLMGQLVIVPIRPIDCENFAGEFYLWDSREFRRGRISPMGEVQNARILCLPHKLAGICLLDSLGQTGSVRGSAYKYYMQFICGGEPDTKFLFEEEVVIAAAGTVARDGYEPIILPQPCLMGEAWGSYYSREDLRGRY